MKKQIVLFPLLLLIGSLVYGQGYLGIGTGTSPHAWTMNLETGFRAKYYQAEFEVKAAPISKSVTEPGVFAFKAGYPVTFNNSDLMIIPMAEYAYMLYSQDEFKTVNYQNGWKAGAGIRIQTNHLFLQADYIGRPYIHIGIIAEFKNRP